MLHSRLAHDCRPGGGTCVDGQLAVGDVRCRAADVCGQRQIHGEAGPTTCAARVGDLPVVGLSQALDLLGSGHGGSVCALGHPCRRGIGRSYPEYATEKSRPVSSCPMCGASTAPRRTTRRCPKQHRAPAGPFGAFRSVAGSSTGGRPGSSSQPGPGRPYLSVASSGRVLR